MANTSAIRAARAFVELFLDQTALERGLKKATVRLKSWGVSISSIGKKMLSGGLLGGTPLFLSAKTFANFESSMSRVKALTNASDSQFAQLNEKAKKLGQDTVYTAAQAADAMGFFALAGYDTNKIMTAIGPTLNMAAAGQIEIAEAAQIAAKIMAGMGIEADELGGVVDVMTKAFTTSNTDLLMLGDAFKFVGPIAKTAGVSIEEITAAIQMLSDAGIQGEMAGTTLRGMILSLTAPSVEAQGVLDELGIKVNDVAGNFRGLPAIISDLENSLAGKGSGEKLGILGRIFDARQAAGAAELISAGADKMREKITALGDATGTASRIAKTQLDNLKGDFEFLTSSLEGVGIAIGETLGPVLRIGMKGLSDAIIAVKNWIEQNKIAVMTIAAVVGSSLALGATLIGLGLGIKAVSFALGTALALLSGFKLMLSLTLGAVTLLASPFSLLAIGLAGITTGFLTGTQAGIKFVKSMKAGFGTMLGDAKEAFDGISDALQAGKIELAAKVLWSVIKLEWARGMNALQNSAISAVNVIISAFNKLISAINVLRDTWSSAQKKIAIEAFEWTGSAEINKERAKITDPFRNDSLGQGVTNEEKIKAASSNRRSAFYQKYKDDHSEAARLKLAEMLEFVDEKEFDALDKLKALDQREKDERERALADIEKQFAPSGKIDPIGAIKPADEAELQKNVDDAKAEFDKLKGEAKDELDKKKNNERKDFEDALQDAMNAADKSDKDLSAQIHKDFLTRQAKLEPPALAVSQALDPTGTFSASIAGRLAPGARIPEKQLQEMQRMNDKLGKIADNTNDLGENFS